MNVTDGGEEGGQNANESDAGGGGIRVAIGVTALAAMLGVGAFVITNHLTDKETAQAPVGGVSTVPGESAQGSASASNAPTSTGAQASPSPSASPISKEVRDKIEAARRKMAKDGVKVDRPLAPKVTRQLTDGDVQMTQSGSLKDGGIVRVVAAPGDLTGQRELAWVDGGVNKYRGVDCSQTFKFSTNPAPVMKPNLLLCWRTSAVKSVIAVVVDPNGHPSKDKAVKELEKKWKSMG
jgi:hypothetical protein